MICDIKKSSTDLGTTQRDKSEVDSLPCLTVWKTPCQWLTKPSTGSAHSYHWTHGSTKPVLWKKPTTLIAAVCAGRFFRAGGFLQVLYQCGSSCDISARHKMVHPDTQHESHSVSACWQPTNGSELWETSGSSHVFIFTLRLCCFYAGL